jgi:hypothetical protein
MPRERAAEVGRGVARAIPGRLRALGCSLSELRSRNEHLRWRTVRKDAIRAKLHAMPAEKRLNRLIRGFGAVGRVPHEVDSGLEQPVCHLSDSQGIKASTRW